MEAYDIRQDFVEHGIRKEIRKGNYLHNPSKVDFGGDIFYLDQGIASLNKINGKGDEQVYLYFGEKRVIGFANALIRHFPFDWDHYITASPFWITAKTTCVYYAIKEAQFEALMAQSQQFTHAMLGAVMLNYMELVNKFQWIMDCNKTAQLCQWLLTCRVEKNGQYVIPKTFTFSEVAKYLGMHPVTVSRIAKKLRDRGAIERKNSCIVLKDEGILKDIIRDIDRGP